ncbi:SWIM zinc finger family protein [Halomicroarcula sp. GCM10025709]|uniref:SWIM zinc finger family protein n=1 Tax=Haloarcula TaxID=2237 RepID=UPI0024C2918A|nr:SWIM zinc finger family protein [Halomicroarcula sp. YJ-61-S]
MTLLTPPDDTDRTALAPDLRSLTDRAARAWTERMAVRELGDGEYAVTTDSGHTYVVDLPDRSCSCPDHRIRGEHCKHLRRIAIEITARRVPAPGMQRARCDACGTETFVDEEVPAPHLCETCRLDPGDVVRDRETGKRLVVVRVTDDRADERIIESTGRSVAAHETNEGYPATDLVVDAVYLPAAVREESPREYAFPHSRLERTDAQLLDFLD